VQREDREFSRRWRDPALLVPPVEAGSRPL